MTPFADPYERLVGQPFPHLRVGLFESVEAGMTLAGTFDEQHAVAGWATGRFGEIVRGGQVHGTRVHVVSTRPRAASGVPQQTRVDACDGFATDAPGVLVTVTAADCVPVLVVARRRPALALVHAGWRGVAAGILSRGIAVLADTFAVAPRECAAYLGPAIGPCCYAVGPEVVDALAGSLPAGSQGWVSRDGEEKRVDLRVVLAQQAAASGLEPDAITASSACTRCQPDHLHSYRRDGHAAGRMVFFAGFPA